jgi:hypothetical protein
MLLLVQEADVPKVMRMRQQDWHEMVAAEGRAFPGSCDSDPEGEPPCPACGTAAPLVKGACSDCGLQLA